MKRSDLESRHANSSERGLTLDQFVKKYFPQHLHLLGGVEILNSDQGRSQSKNKTDAIPTKLRGTALYAKPPTRSVLAGSGVPAVSPAQTPQQKWRKKNKKKLADYQKEYRAKNK